MTETEAWMPSLSNPPEFAGPLLSGLRRVLPAMFDAALQAPEHPTKPFSATMDVTDDPSAGLTPWSAATCSAMTTARATHCSCRSTAKRNSSTGNCG